MAIKTDEQAEEVIRLQGIGKSYYIGDQEVPVLTHIDLSITKGNSCRLWALPGLASPH